MVEKADSHRGTADRTQSDMTTDSPSARLDAWFDREILPLEALLMQYLEHNWRNRSDLPDLRQEAYVRVYQAALSNIPEKPRQFLLATARNLLIDRVRHEQVVPIESAADLETLGVALDAPGPERIVIARDELRRLQAALDRLSPRCREVVVLARIEGFSRGQIAQRLGISEVTVSSYLTQGICALADILHGEPSNIRRST
ncbi:MAG TPA: RNA polymerase sigma factor [Rhizomicrobium sp.]|nr:RNA polymerase sigma factor [Rhizomicrobium sp.]